MPALKVLQLNIWMGRMSRALQRYIAESGADIICLQEVLTTDVAPAYPDYMHDILDRLKVSSGLEYAFFSANTEFANGASTTQMGNLILSRYPFKHIESHELFNLVTPTKTNDHTLQIALIEIDGQEVAIANHHGVHDVNPLGNETTVASLALAREIVEPYLHLPFVFCGDFNVISESPAMRAFDDLHDIIADPAHGVTTTLSHLNHPINVVCDHILINDRIRVTSFTVERALISDHFPLVLECDIIGATNE